MGYPFLDAFRTPRQQKINEAREERQKISKSPAARRIARRKGSEAAEEMRKIALGKDIAPAKMVQKITLALSNSQTASTIIFGQPPQPSEREAGSKQKSAPSKHAPCDQASGDAPAARVAHSERLKKKKKRRQIPSKQLRSKLAVRLARKGEKF